MRTLKHNLVLFALLTILFALPAWASAATSGTCGDNLTWVLDDSGTLTISGEGEMEDYYLCTTPWQGETLSNIIIQEGVTSIGACAFEECDVISISIPNSVVNIGYKSFRMCENLVAITIPDSVASIGEFAFESCCSLTSLTIPNSVKSIGEKAFAYCDNLSDISIPDSYINIGSFAFADCGQLYANMHGPLALALSAAGHRFIDLDYHPSLLLSVSETDTGVRSYYVTGSCDEYITSLIIPGGVTHIQEYSFDYYSNLTSVSIPSGVTHIGKHAFYQCSALTNVSIPASVSTIDKSAFEGCTALKKATIPGCVISNSYNRLCDYFGKSLEEVTIADGVTSIGADAFSPSYNLKVLSIPNSVNTVDIEALNLCGDLDRITVPSCMINSSNRSFSDYFIALRINEVSIADGVTYIRDNAFYDNSFMTSIYIPSTVTSIGSNAFTNCSKLTDVTLSEGLTSIGDYAFKGCHSLYRICLPTSLNSIGYDVFCNSGIGQIYAPTLTDWLEICFKSRLSDHSLELYIGDVLLTDLTIPENITSISDYCFSNLYFLSSITIPQSTTNIDIGFRVFHACPSITEIHAPSLAQWLNFSSDLSGFEYPFDNQAKLYINGVPLTKALIPDGIDEIVDYAFYGFDDLTSISIPNSVTRIGTRAFASCNSLTNISIPDGVINIEEYAFENCGNLNSITIPSSVSTIGNFAFASCSNLTSIIIPGTTRPAYTLDIPANFTVYCYEYTDVDFWAVENGYNVSYLDNQSGPITFQLTVLQPTMEKGATQTLLVTLVPEAESPAITWSSSASSVVSVTDGVVTAVNPGTATITATCAGKSASVTIEVHANAESLTISPAEFWVISKETTQVQINALPAGADVSFELSGHDSTTITPTVSGNTINVLALRPGDTTFTVTDSVSGLSQTCTVHVVYPVTAVAFAPASVSVPLNGAAQLTANVTARDQTVTNQLVTFSSSDEAIATVDQQGVVTGLTKGTATITATATSGVSASCTVTVRDALTFTLPASLTTLGTEALMDTGAEVYVLPQGMTTISSRAFAGCSRLTRVIIPDSVTSIAADAFEGCSSFVIVAPEGSTAHTFATENGISWVCE